MTKLLLERVNHLCADIVLLVKLLKVVSLLGAVLASARCAHQRQEAKVKSTYLAFRPTGETLIMPFLNSTNVPLATASAPSPLDTKYQHWNPDTYRLIGTSTSDRYRRIKLTSFLYSSSPTYLMKEADSSSLPSFHAVRPFSAKQ